MTALTRLDLRQRLGTLASPQQGARMGAARCHGRAASLGEAGGALLARLQRLPGSSCARTSTSATCCCARWGGPPLPDGVPVPVPGCLACNLHGGPESLHATLQWYGGAALQCPAILAGFKPVHSSKVAWLGKPELHAACAKSFARTCAHPAARKFNPVLQTLKTCR